MKIVKHIPCYQYRAKSQEAQEVIIRVTNAGKQGELDTLMDTLWAPDGLTEEEWEKFLVEHHDHILNKLTAEGVQS